MISLGARPASGTTRTSYLGQDSQAFSNLVFGEGWREVGREEGREGGKGEEREGEPYLFNFFAQNFREIIQHALIPFWGALLPKLRGQNILRIVKQNRLICFLNPLCNLSETLLKSLWPPETHLNALWNPSEFLPGLDRSRSLLVNLIEN